MGVASPSPPPTTTPAERFDQEIRYLKKRTLSSFLVVVVLAAGIFVPMSVDHSNSSKKQPLHLATVLSTYLSVLCGMAVCGLIQFLPSRETCRRRPYIVVKALIHACVLFLVSLSFSLSLMMRMNIAVTSPTVAAAAALVMHRLWRCAMTDIDDDLAAYRGCEEEIQQLLELSSNIMSMLFGGWFGMAFFYFKNNPVEATHAWFLPSEYLTFFTSVAASLTLLKVVPRSPAPPWPCLGPAEELRAMIGALILGVVATALAIAACKVGGYAALALVPEVVALAAWAFPAQGGAGGGGDHREPPPHGFVSVAMALLLAVITYRAKTNGGAGAGGGLSSLYDEAFVLVATATVVAALGWRMVTMWTRKTTTAAAGEEDHGMQAAAKVLAFFTFFLLAVGVLAFLGFMYDL